MSQTFFSKLDQTEKASRLNLLGTSESKVTLWIKGQKDKITLDAAYYNKEAATVTLKPGTNPYPSGSTLLCTFDLRGMSFFSQVQFRKDGGGDGYLLFPNDLFKSERRSSFRLLAFPQYDIWSKFDLNEASVGGKVIGLKSKQSNTGLFKNFLNLVDGGEEQKASGLRIRVQDISTSGLALHVGEIESQYFSKDTLFQNVEIQFSDEVILIPEVKVVYLVDYIGSDKNLKKYKVGLTFPDIKPALDDQLSRKITKLLRESDFNKDFENFLK